MRSLLFVMAAIVAVVGLVGCSSSPCAAPTLVWNPIPSFVQAPQPSIQPMTTQTVTVPLRPDYASVQTVPYAAPCAPPAQRYAAPPCP